MLIGRALHRGSGKRPEVLNHGHAHSFDRCVPELLIRGAGQEDRSSGYENEFLSGLANRYSPGYQKRMRRNSRFLLSIATKFGQWFDIIISQ